MKKIKYIIFFFLFFGISLFSSKFLSFALEKNIFDYAELFSKEEKQDLENLYTKLGEEKDIKIICVTKKSLNGKTREKFLSDFYDKNDFGNCIILLIQMEEGKRGVQIQSFREAGYQIDSNKIENILDKIIPILKQENYKKACQTFANQVVNYIETDPKNQMDYESLEKQKQKKKTLTYLFICIPIALIIGGVCVTIMAYYSKGAVTTNSFTYLDSSHSKTLANQDIYIRTAVTKIKDTQNENNNPHSSDKGTTEKGTSYSSGGRDF